MTTLIALDANKVFDSVWHAGLLRTLHQHHLGVRTRRWVAAFLRDRRATVLEDGHLSRASRATAGVPQGSPLPSLLYTLYTAEMPLPRDPLQGASVYADDVAMWACARTPSEALQRLRPVLHRAVRWGRRWRVSFNPAKTQVGFFSRRTRWEPGQASPPRVLGVEHQWAHSVDLLGVRLDRRLSFTAHARRAAQRLAPKIAALRRWTWTYPTVPSWVGALVARAILRPVYLYAAPVLQIASSTALDGLNRLERRVLRAGLRRGVYFPLDRLYAMARLPDLNPHLCTLGGNFLLRATERRHRRILAAFSTWAPQRADIARKDVLLERLFALLCPGDRRLVQQTLSDLGVFPGSHDERRRGRSRAVYYDAWGVSPFD